MVFFVAFQVFAQQPLFSIFFSTYSQHVRAQKERRKIPLATSGNLFKIPENKKKRQFFLAVGSAIIRSKRVKWSWDEMLILSLFIKVYFLKAITCVGSGGIRRFFILKKWPSTCWKVCFGQLNDICWLNMAKTEGLFRGTIGMIRIPKEYGRCMHQYT